MAEHEYVPSNLRLARFPVHWISTAPAPWRGLYIDFVWESHYSYWHLNYGRPPRPPGAIGMKVDKLVVYPALHADPGLARKGRLIRLGSLRSIAKQIGSGEGNTTAIVNALRDNAAVQLRVGRGPHDFQNRYDVFLPDERLPGRKVADAVYIRPSDAYLEWARGAAWSIRLRRDLLRDLPPASARLYEILATLGRRSTATLLYSDICQYLPLRRGRGLEASPSRLDRLHEPLKDRGLIAGVAYERIEYMGQSRPPDDDRPPRPPDDDREKPAAGEVFSSPRFYLVEHSLQRDWEVRYVYGKDAASAFRAVGHEIRVGWEAATRAKLSDIPGWYPNRRDDSAAGPHPGG